MKEKKYYHNPYCTCGKETVKISDQIVPCFRGQGQCHIQRFCCKKCGSRIKLLCYPKNPDPFPHDLNFYQVTDRTAYLPVFSPPHISTLTN